MAVAQNTRASVQIPEIPKGLEPKLAEYLQSLSRSVQQVDKDTVHKDSAVGSILLASPDGSVYTVGVADDGTLTTTLAYQA